MEASPQGALIVGGPDEVIDKIRHYDEVLGGITRLTFQMDLAALPHATPLRSLNFSARVWRLRCKKPLS